MKSKKCAKCGSTWPATTKYYRVKSKSADGLEGVCKQCVRAQDRERYAIEVGGRPVKQFDYDDKYADMQEVEIERLLPVERLDVGNGVKRVVFGVPAPLPMDMREIRRGTMRTGHSTLERFC